MPSILQAAFTSAALFVLALSATAQSAAPPPTASTGPSATAEPPSTKCPGALVTAKVDRFSGVTAMTTPQDAKAGYHGLEPHLWAVFDHGGRVITLQLFGSFAEWRYLKCHNTHLLADGARIKLGEEEFHGDISSHGGVYERIQVILSPAALARIGSASKIEFKVCNDEFQASEEFVLAAHEFACKVAERFGAKPAKQP